MSRGSRMVDARVPESLILRIDQAAGQRDRERFAERLEPILPHLNWRTHLYLVPGGASREVAFTRLILRSLARFLTENEFASFYVHPLIRIAAEADAGPARWRALLDEVRPFQRDAYQQQTEARLLILPIIEPAEGTADRHWLEAARFFLRQACRPAVVLRGQAALDRARGAEGEEIRFYVDPQEGSGADGVVRQLWANAVFEDLLERVRAGATGTDLLSACRTHRLIDQPSGEVYSCFHDWSLGRPLDTLENISGSGGAGIAAECRRDACAACISRSLCSMTESLIANRREAEGRKVHFELALACSRDARHREAIEHADRARQLASTGSERSEALVVQGLCHLGLRQLPQAEGALREAALSAEDPGLVSFHRGRVQFEWRDYIEALERFEEALASGSSTVPRADLFYYMAVSHIHLQEYSEARPHLARWEETGANRATMLYYRGLCDIGEERFESALAELRACREAGPLPEEMGNVLFYTGYCLKQLDGCGEAIPLLERAAELDPGGIDVLNLLGFCYYKTARHAEAVACFERAVRIDPRSAIDYANLARNLAELGRIEEAIEHYRRALALDPQIGFAREQLRRLGAEPE